MIYYKKNPKHTTHKIAAILSTLGCDARSCAFADTNTIADRSSIDAETRRRIRDLIWFDRDGSSSIPMRLRSRALQTNGLLLALRPVSQPLARALSRSRRILTANGGHSRRERAAALMEKARALAEESTIARDRVVHAKSA
jgi:hypothetical protein